MSEQSLLLMRLDALYTRCGDRMARANEPWGEGAPAPLLLVGRTLRGETVWRFGMQAEPGFAGRAQALLSSGAWDPDAVPDALGLRAAAACARAAPTRRALRRWRPAAVRGMRSAR